MTYWTEANICLEQTEEYLPKIVSMLFVKTRKNTINGKTISFYVKFPDAATNISERCTNSSFVTQFLIFVQHCPH